MIPERWEELACLYVLEALSGTERQEFENELRVNPELQSLVATLRATRDAFATTVPPVTPRPEVKQRIMAEVTARAKKVQPRRPARRSWFDLSSLWLPWAMAAAAVVFALHLYTERGELKQQLGRQTAEIVDLDQLADELRGATNNLQQTVARLQKSAQTDDLRIALLNSLLSDSPKTVAVSLWDNQQQSGVFVVQNLKPLPANSDYQLWVIDPQYQTPVSAGVFQVDDSGNVRLHFKAAKAIITASKFAVTLEPKGGLPTPTMKNLVLVGG